MTLDETAVDTQSPVAGAPGGSSNHPCGRIRWTAIHTHPQAETWASHCLNQRGYQTYLPLYATTLRDRTLPTLSRTALRPLFPGYLFAALRDDEPWTPIRYSPGVRNLIMSSGKVVYARAGTVEALQATEASRRTLTTPDALYRPGAPCKLAHGPFQGLDAVVTSIHGSYCTIAAVMLGELRNIEAKLSAIVPR